MRRGRSGLWLTAFLFVPVALAGGWYLYYPTYLRSRQTAELDAALAAKDFSQAEELLRPLLRQYPQDARLYLAQARVLRRLQRPEEATRALWEAENRGL